MLDLVKLATALKLVRRPVAGASRHKQNGLSLLTATLGPSGDVVAGLVGSGGLGVALPCASALTFSDPS